MRSKPLNLNDVFNEAKRLSSRSAQLRLFLAQLHKFRDRIEAQPQGLHRVQNRLAELVETVRAEMPEAIPEPETYGEALKSLTNPAFIKGARHRTNQTRPDRSGADPDILRFERAFVRRFEKLGVPIFPHSITRGRAEQTQLYVTGRSQARFGSSPHNFGMAVDLVHGTRAWNIPRAGWDILGHVGFEVAAQLGLELVWGGKWRFYDPAHWELKDWRLRAAKRGLRGLP